MSNPIVAIVGRPNVGKSSLFNRLIGKRVAIVDEEAGVTRDRNYYEVEWSRHRFVLIDTGGYIPSTKTELEAAVREQVRQAAEEADLIIMVVDVLTGITDLDLGVAEMLRRLGKACLLIVNKVDDTTRETDTDQFYKLGIGEPFPVSAMTGRNSGDLLDLITLMLPNQRATETDDQWIKVAVVGRPNVGKSSFINRLLGQQRVLVDPKPGTTRDSVDTPFEMDNKKFLLIDTAGLRKRSRVSEKIEFYSTLRAINALERCDIALTLIDAVEGFGAQDMKIIAQALDLGKGVVLVVNKWDLVEKDSNTAGTFAKALKDRLASIDYPAIVYISALTGQRIRQSMEIAARVAENRERRIATSELNEFLNKLVKIKPPTKLGRPGKLFYCTQHGIKPPSFVFFVNEPDIFTDNYRRFLEKNIRERFDFEGTPIKVWFRRRK